MEDYQEYLRHFPKYLSKEIQEYATEQFFNCYIFTHRKGKQQYGYCTHCHKEFATSGLKHNGNTKCPKCRSVCTVKASGISRQYMVDEAYFVYYEKSAINPSIIIARGIYAVRDYTGDYRGIRTKYLVRVLYLFEMGKSVMLSRYGYYSRAKTMEHGLWGKHATVFSMAGAYNQNNLRLVTGCSIESIKKAIAGTQFQYSTWDQYGGEDMVKFFGLYAKYPCIEYLTKLELTDLVEAKLLGNHTFSAINWRGKSLLQVLRLSKKDLKDIRSAKFVITPLKLRLFQLSKKDGSNLSWDEVAAVDQQIGWYFKDLQLVLKYTIMRRALAYIRKQRSKYEKQYYSSDGNVLTTWRDYINDCIHLEMDLSQDRVLFPGNLHRAHQNTIKQIKLRKDELLDKKIAARLKSLDKYHFEALGFFARPAASSTDLIDEGKALHHCVGTYADQYAEGKTIILFIRKMEQPDVPFYTLEFRKDYIVQVRGKDNRPPDEAVKAFVDKFKAARLTKQEERVRITVPA